MRIAVLTGAGISAESGLKTFRDSDGLWEGYAVEEVATPQAWRRDPELVQKFYNERRAAVLGALPNAAHIALAKLGTKFKTTIVTQNIDDLHERAGSDDIVHLHGEIKKSCSSIDHSLVYEIEGDTLRMGEKCEKGSQLRPFIVWFGEPVPMMEIAIERVEQADLLLVIGTSLAVYPAAGLVDYLPHGREIYLIDPKATQIPCPRSVRRIAEKATVGVPKIVDELCASY